MTAEWEPDSRAVGHVIEVGPSHITVQIDREAPHGTAFSQERISYFPRLNGFVVLPTEAGSILAIVVWIGVTDELLSLRSRSDQVGLPAPRRALRAMPLGVIRTSREPSGQVQRRLDRGVLGFPTVGDPVRLPDASEAKVVVPRVSERDGLYLGTAPLAGDAPVVVSGRRLFGRHVAVLGNTGSGKSCTVTQLIRGAARATDPTSGTLRAVILDLNGEYENAFNDLDPSLAVKKYSVAIGLHSTSAAQLRVPFWLWNYREWAAFCGASGKSQAPVLRQALHILRSSDTQAYPRGTVRIIAGKRTVRTNKLSEDKEQRKQGFEVLAAVKDACGAIIASSSEPLPAVAALQGLLEASTKSRFNPPGSQYRFSFDVAPLSVAEEANLLAAMDAALLELRVPMGEGDTSSVDTPIPFDAKNLVDLTGVVAAGMLGDAQAWIAPMQDRLAVAMNDARLTSVCGFQGEETLATWLTSILGESGKSQITVLDLSLVPANAQHVLAAVVGRLILEGQERHRRAVGLDAAPVILVVEEAHALIRRRGEFGVDEAGVDMAELCRETFERVAREGRKFGVSLVISSQRPSELSETALSQCNSFLVHRIVNGRDQDAVRRMVPDSVGALLSELPSLPSQTALLIGAAAEVPVLIHVDDLALELRPNSADPAFERAWASGMPWDVAALTRTWLQTSATDLVSDLTGVSARLGHDNLDDYEPPDYEVDPDDPPF